MRFMIIRKVSGFYLLLFLAIPNSIVAKDSDEAEGSEPQGSEAQTSQATTNSDSSSDQGDWLLKALEQGEAESSNPQGSTRQTNREEVPVIDVSSEDEESLPTGTDKNFSGSAHLTVRSRGQGNPSAYPIGGTSVTVKRTLSGLAYFAGSGRSSIGQLYGRGDPPTRTDQGESRPAYQAGQTSGQGNSSGSAASAAVQRNFSGLAHFAGSGRSRSYQSHAGFGDQVPHQPQPKRMRVTPTPIEASVSHLHRPLDPHPHHHPHQNHSLPMQPPSSQAASGARQHHVLPIAQQHQLQGEGDGETNKFKGRDQPRN